MTIKDKLPLPDWRFGIEIECAVPLGHESLARELTRLTGLEARYTDQGEYATWEVHNEGIGVNGLYNLELVSPRLRGEEGLAQIKTMMATLQRMGAVVSAAAGMHVHLDRSHLSDAALGHWHANFIRYEKCFDQLVARRRTCGYPQSNAVWLAARMRDGEHRYGATNVIEYARLATVAFARNLLNKGPKFSPREMGTVELRQHQGSLNGTRAAHWLSLMLHFAAVASQDAVGVEMFDGSEASVKSLLAYAGVPYATRRYWLARRRDLIDLTFSAGPAGETFANARRLKVAA